MYGLSDLPQFKEELGLSPYICDTFWPYIFGQFGFLGLVIYCWILFLLLKQLCLTIKQFPVGFSKIFALGSFILFVQSLVASIADPVFTKVPHNIFIFGCLGISYALARGTKKNEHPFNK